MLKLIERSGLSTALFTASCLTMLVGCSSGELQVPADAEDFIHEASQIPFPVTQNSFVRQSIKEGVPDESGVTATYLFRQAGSEVTITLSVYRNPDPQSDEVVPGKEKVRHTEAQQKRLDAIEAEILEAGKDEEHRFVAAYDIAIERDGQAFFGKRSFFRDRFEFFSNAYLFEYGEWFVEYRTVFARDLERVAEQFVLDHSWGEIKKDDEES